MPETRIAVIPGLGIAPERPLSELITDSAELEALFERMPQAQRLTILDLVDRDGLRGMVAFRENIDLLARISRRR